MKSFAEWMSAYGESHRNPLNKKIHNVCVPLITFSVVALLWTAMPALALGFVLACLAFYLSLNFRIFLGMAAQTALVLGACLALDARAVLAPVATVVFVLGWLGQFYGHKVEGKKPSFLEDLVFLLIGPLWVTKSLYDFLGIRLEPSQKGK
jgi:uncharacterized membrane protein YGL010W